VKLGKALLGYKNSPGSGVHSFYKLEQNAVNTTAPKPIATSVFCPSVSQRAKQP